MVIWKKLFRPFCGEENFASEYYICFGEKNELIYYNENWK